MFKYDYLQSKLHGILANSIVGDKFERLKRISSIENLSKELFPGENIAVPIHSLFSHMERKYKRKVFNQIYYIARFFKFKNIFINTLILKYEIENVKHILMSFYNKNKNIDELFEINMNYSINYEYVYHTDLSKLRNIIMIFSKTIFKFIIPFIEDKLPLYEIENMLDKFYYESLIEEVSHLKLYEKKRIMKIIIVEMDLQNIAWAFRLKNYYKKTFKNVKSTFLVHEKLIGIDIIEEIFETQYIGEEIDKCMKGVPKEYCKIVKKSLDEYGNVNLAKLEELSFSKVMKKYIKFFYSENFNILPVISFIYIKQIEYLNIVRLIESLRYKISLETI